ncbi:MAG: malectin domain-containing carbohydrate-binding protein [Planctomycetota bacterium]
MTQTRRLLCAVFVVLGPLAAVADAGSTFIRGDTNGDGSFNISDPVFTLNVLFPSMDCLQFGINCQVHDCVDAADADDDGGVNISDAVILLTALFAGGAPPAPPFPNCGVDPTPADPFDCVSTDTCPLASLPPTITSAPVTNATVGSLYLYEVQATDPDPGDTITFTLPVGPTGATVVTGTGQIFWSPTVAQAGANDFVVRATDAAGLFAEQPFTVVVAAQSNLQPIITTPARSLATVMVDYEYDVDAIDPNVGDQLTYSLIVAPTGAMIDASTGMLTWTPAGADLGSQNFTVRVTDNGTPPLFVEQAFVVETQYRIDAGATVPYVATDGSVWAADFGYDNPPGEVFTFPVPVSGTADSPIYQRERFTFAPAFSYSLPLPLGTAPYQVLLHFAEIALNGPGFRSFDVLLEGQVVLDEFDIFASYGFQQAAIEAFDVRIADGVLTLTFAEGSADHPTVSGIEVLVGSASNRAPIFTSVPLTFAVENAVYTYQATAVDQNIGDVVTFSMAPFPGATMSPGGLLTWTPSAAQVGVNALTVTATDGHGESTDQDFIVSVVSAPNNMPPVFDFPPVTTATVGRQYIHNAHATDSDPGNTVTHTLQVAPAGAQIDAATGVITWTPSSDQVADNLFVVRATDDGSPVQFRDLMYSVVTGLRVNCGDSTVVCCGGQERWPLDTGFFGNTGVFTGTDPIAGTIEQGVYQTLRFWTVAGGGYAIPIANGAYFVRLHYAETFFTADGARVFDIDMEGCRVVSDFDIHATVGHDVATQQGSLVTVDDGILEIEFVSVVDLPVVSGIEILAGSHGANIAPVFTTTPVPAASSGLQYTYAAVATDADVCQMPTYALVQGPGTMDSVTGQLTWTPSVLDEGSMISFTITALDSFGGVATQEWQVLVSAPGANNLPSFTSVPPTAATVTVPFTYTAAAIDPDVGDVLTYTLTAAPAGVTIDANTGELSWLPVPQDIGEQIITVRATDLATDFVEQTFAVTTAYRINCGDGLVPFDDGTQVWSPDLGFDLATSATFTVSNSIAGTSAEAVYQSGRFPSPGATTAYAIGVPNGNYRVQLHFAEIFFDTAGQRVFDVAVEGCAALAQYDIYSAALAATAAGNNYAVVETSLVEVTDGMLDLVVSNNVGDAGYINGIQVFADAGNNVVPAITSAPALLAAPASPYSYAVTARDANSCQMLTYSLTQGPAAAMFDPVSRVLTWAPQMTDLGAHDFTVSVTDGVSPPVLQSWTVVVALPQAPVIDLAVLPLNIASVNELFTYTVAVIDPGDTVTFMLDPASPAGATIDPVTGVIEWVPTGQQIGVQTIVVIVEDSTNLTDSAAFVVDAAYRINCGATTLPLYFDVNGDPWARDFGFNGGPTTFVPAGMPAIDCAAGDDELFSSIHFATPTSVTYSLPLPAPAACYRVRLYFAEIDPMVAVGMRVFDVAIEGTVVETGFDIVAAALGECAPSVDGRFALVVREYTTPVADGEVAITLTNVSGSEAIISAIDVSPVACP